MDRLIGALEGRYRALPGSPDGGHQATLEQLWYLAYREASILDFADAFRAILLVLVVAALLVPLMRKVAAPAPTGGQLVLTVPQDSVLALLSGHQRATIAPSNSGSG